METRKKALAIVEFFLKKEKAALAALKRAENVIRALEKVKGDAQLSPVVLEWLGGLNLRKREKIKEVKIFNRNCVAVRTVEMFPGVIDTHVYFYYKKPYHFQCRWCGFPEDGEKPEVPVKVLGLRIEKGVLFLNLRLTSGHRLLEAIL